MATLEAKLEALLSTAACDSEAGEDDLEVYGDGDYAEEEELVEITEQEALQHLDALNPPLEVCGRLFFDEPRAPLRVIPGTAAATLRANGFVVLDGVCPLSEAASLRADALRLYAEGAFSRPPMHEGYTDATARGDEILWVHPGSELVTGAPGVASAASLLLALRDDIGSILALRRGQAELQLAVYPPGGAAQYRRHRDAFPDDGSAEDQRRVTAVLYATEPDWDVEVDGGGLRVFPPGLKGHEGEVIAPLPGRVVVFLSGAVDHEVLPCVGGRPRVALTAWLQ